MPARRRPPRTRLKPKLYAVDDRRRATTPTRPAPGYAADDARGFADALQKQNGGLYSRRRRCRRSSTATATRTSVIEALGWLGSR